MGLVDNGDMGQKWYRGKQVRGGPPSVAVTDKTMKGWAPESSPSTERDGALLQSRGGGAGGSEVSLEG